MIDKVKNVLKVVVENKPNVVVDEVNYGFDAPTKTGEEIAIDLFPSDWNGGDYDAQKFYHECMGVFNELSAILINDVVCDIDITNTWNFIYVVL